VVCTAICTETPFTPWVVQKLPRNLARLQHFESDPGAGRAAPRGGLRLRLQQAMKPGQRHDSKPPGKKTLEPAPHRRSALIQPIRAAATVNGRAARTKASPAGKDVRLGGPGGPTVAVCCRWIRGSRLGSWRSPLSAPVYQGYLETRPAPFTTRAKKLSSGGLRAGRDRGVLVPTGRGVYNPVRRSSGESSREAGEPWRKVR
jgi:hypothetical protein